MDYVDANYILRYLLKDVAEQYLKAVNVIENENLFVPDFIVAEDGTATRNPSSAEASEGRQ